MKEIDVSVILSAYNEEERWFREAVESIINQSYENFELILILDNPNNTLLEGKEFRIGEKIKQRLRVCKR